MLQALVKNRLANAGDIRDAALIPGLRRSPGEGMATHSSIPTEKSGELQSTRSQRVGNHWRWLACMQRCFSGGQLLFWGCYHMEARKREKGEGKKEKKSYVFILKLLQSLMGLVNDIINYPNSQKDNANATNTASSQILWGHLRALEAGDLTRLFRAIPLYSSIMN